MRNGSGVPTLIFATPFNPKAPEVFSFNLIFMMPDMPSGSYLAEGLVITSTLSTELAGICSSSVSKSFPIISYGRPLISTLTLEEPRSVTVPSLSTETLGTVSNTSVAVPPLDTRFLSTLTTRLSSWYSTMVRSALTCTSSIITALGEICILPSLTVACLSPSVTVSGWT